MEKLGENNKGVDIGAELISIEEMVEKWRSEDSHS